jgi:ABC-type transport system involved in multi-copper enzyme maturation permease subunit
LALRTLFNEKEYIPPSLESLPEDLRRWPVGWLLSNPASFYISFMFLLSFLLVMPSIILLRRMAQATVTEKPLHRLILGGTLAVGVLVALLVGGPSSVYVAGVVAVIAFGVLLPWVKDPSWVPMLNRGEATEAVGAATGGPRTVGRAPRSRKPRTVWANPIAWREAKTKASAARASLLRYGFIFAGLVGAVILVYRYSRINVPEVSVGPTDFNPSLMQLTIGTETYRVPTFEAATSNEYPIKHEADDSGNPDQKKLEAFDLNSMKAPMEVIPNSLKSDGVRLGRGARTITNLELRPITRMLEANDARKYLLGLSVIEFAVILLIVTNAAASTVTREKEDGTLDLLLSSPITSRYYIWGKLRGLVSFVLPLVAVPVASALIFVIYDVLRLTANSADPDFKWIVFPEAVVLLPGMLIIVSAFAAILGMQMSLRCRTTVMAVMSSVGIVVGVCAAMGFCGFKMLDNASSTAGISVGIGSFSPFTLMQMLINPYASGRAFTGGAGDDDPVTSNRLIIVVCSLIAIAGYTAIVWSMYQSMVKNFDMTIRKQAR